jgi:hypothetical protein
MVERSTARHKPAESREVADISCDLTAGKTARLKAKVAAAVETARTQRGTVGADDGKPWRNPGLSLFVKAVIIAP